MLLETTRIRRNLHEFLSGIMVAGGSSRNYGCHHISVDDLVQLILECGWEQRDPMQGTECYHESRRGTSMDTVSVFKDNSELKKIGSCPSPCPTQTVSTSYGMP
ncbi:hypothetical protein D3C72_1368770 [compost metagenome]